MISHSDVFYAGTSKKITTICPNVIQCQDIQMLSTAPTMGKWDLYSAVCLERHPIVLQPMQELELKFHNMLKRIEFEKSLKSDHELKVEREKKQQKSISTDDLEDSISIQTAQDFEDSCQEELNNFKFASLVTGIYIIALS